jgi:hypothetical protein
MKDSRPQQIEFCPAIHLPFEQLQPIDLAFRLAVAPLRSQCGTHGCFIIHKSIGEGS